MSCSRLADFRRPGGTNSLAVAMRTLVLVPSEGLGRHGRVRERAAIAPNDLP